MGPGPLGPGPGPGPKGGPGGPRALLGPFGALLGPGGVRGGPEEGAGDLGRTQDLGGGTFFRCCDFSGNSGHGIGIFGPGFCLDRVPGLASMDFLLLGGIIIGLGDSD